jgi:hypothetical protein
MAKLIGNAPNQVPTNGDLGELAFLDKKFAGITEADQFRLTSNLTLTTSTTDITANLERVDTNGFGSIGTGMTESSGIFTFPSTGMYLIKANFTGEDATNTPFYILGNIATTTNNSSYTTNSRSHTTVATTGDAFGFSVDTMFNVTDTTTHKVKFQYEAASTTAIFYGNTSNNYTYFQFIRLGDSV